MKRWAWITVGLYAATLALLMFPVCLGLHGDWWGATGWSLEDVVGMYRSLAFWVWVAILTGGQAALLLIPLKVTERRLRSRRSVLVPAGLALFLVGLLSFLGLGSILGALFADEGVDKLWQTGTFMVTGPESLPESGILKALPARKASDDTQALLGSLNLILVFWTVWGVAFWRFARKDSAGDLFQRVMRWLLRGSILELLIAVPSHIIVRRRGDCCAPSVTFMGIVTGVAVALMCFGPGVYYLLVQRCHRLKAPEKPPTSP